MILTKYVNSSCIGNEKAMFQISACCMQAMERAKMSLGYLADITLAKSTTIEPQ